MPEDELELFTLHDIPTAWHKGLIGHPKAMRLAKIDDLDDLHEAAELSGVEVDRAPNDGEDRWTSTPSCCS